MKYWIFIVLLSALSPLLATGENVIITGKAPDYAGLEISFYTFTDPVLHEKKELAIAKIGNEGNFSVSFSTNQTLEVYSNLEKYTGTLIVEPGMNYVITLPPFSPRSAIEAKSPFFEPTLYWFGLPNAQKNDLNLLVRAFINDYQREIIRNSSALRNISVEKVKDIILNLEQRHSAVRNDFFTVLRKYYYADLENTANPGQPEIVISKYFNKEPVKLQHPAYQKTFEALFTDYLRKQSLDYRNKAIAQLINSGDFAGLVSFFEKKGQNKEVAELVVLKGLVDGYHTGGFDKENILKVLTSAQNSASDNLRQVIKSAREKLTRLAARTFAPPINLKNQRNESVTLEKYKGKYLYLNFIKSSSRESRFELDTLKHAEKKLRQVLTVVSVATDENFETAVRLWKEKDYPWELLNGSQGKYLVDSYNARIVPAFYLIGPDGKFVLSPAPSPSHEFEPAFLKIFREKGIKPR